MEVELYINIFFNIAFCKIVIYFGVNHNYISFVKFYGKLIVLFKRQIMEQKLCREFKTHWF